MNRRRPPAQMAFPFENTIPPPQEAERPEVYLAVRSLRWDGCSVFRAGSGRHVVDGRQVTTPALIALAKAVTRDIGHKGAMERLGFRFDASGACAGLSAPAWAASPVYPMEHHRPSPPANP